MKSKEDKAKMFIEYKYYMDYVVYSFLSLHPTYYYMKDDLQSECYLRFLELVDSYREDEGAVFTTYLKSSLDGYLLNRIKYETKITIKSNRYKQEYGSLEEMYEMENPFDKIITDAELTPKQENVIRMKFEDDIPEAKIAKRLSVTQQAVNRILKRAYAKILNTYAS